MKTIFALSLTLFAWNGYSESNINCSWTSSAATKNFHAEDNLKSFNACSLFIRGQILGAQSSFLGDFGRLMIGTDPLGTLTYTDTNGFKRVCETRPKKNPLDQLNRSESLAAYLKAEIDGQALTHEDEIRANEVIKNLGIDLNQLTRKIDDSIILICNDQVS